MRDSFCNTRDMAYKEEDHWRKVKSFRIHPQLLEKLKAASKKHHISESQLTEIALKHHLKALEDQ